MTCLECFANGKGVLAVINPAVVFGEAFSEKGSQARSGQPTSAVREGGGEK